MTAAEKLLQAAVWHLEEPCDGSRQALAEAATGFEEWQRQKRTLVANLFHARREEAAALVDILNGGGEQL